MEKVRPRSVVLDEPGPRVERRLSSGADEMVRQFVRLTLTLSGQGEHGEPAIRCSAKFGARSEIAQSAVVRAPEPRAMPLVDFKRALNLEFVLYVKDHPHPWPKPVAIALDVLPGAGDVEPEATVSLCFVGVRVDPWKFVVHVICQCAERSR